MIHGQKVHRDKKVVWSKEKLKLTPNKYDAIIISVAHDKFKKMGKTKLLDLCKKNHVIYDLKHLFFLKTKLT